VAVNTQTRVIAVFGALITLSAILFLGVVIVLRVDPAKQEAAHEAEKSATSSAGASGHAADKLIVARCATPFSVPDPSGACWSDTPSLEIKLIPQAIAIPKLDRATVESVQIQSLHDGQKIAWRLVWSDPTPDATVDVSRFGDGVAIQFPLVADAPVTMGAKGKPVQTLYWKALWQKDIAEHFQDVEDLHPNFYSEFYWFAQGERPFRIPAAFQDPRSRIWFPAQQAGNPASIFDRKEPVQELTAQGFGTLTPHKDIATEGKGIWKNGRWEVVFMRPLTTTDPLDYQFKSGAAGLFAVAVWDGTSGNVGARKQYCNWLPLEVRP
jgi:hypothetical protein